jgi:hypothetical protein
MYDLRNIGVHIEISSNCNSRCLDCGRFVKGTDLINPYLDIGSQGLMSLSVVNNIFDDAICQNLKYVNFTGTYGDAITHPEFFEILKLIAANVAKNSQQRQANGLPEQTKLMIETNGGLHDSEWWQEFTEIVNNNFSRDSIVIFALDGIDDATHQMYRRGVNFDKALANAKTVIANRGRAVWSMISFAHNEHQLEQARQMSTDLGFKTFKIRRSRLRSVPTQTVSVLDNSFQKRKDISTDQVQYSSEHSKFFTVTEANKSTKFYFENPSMDAYFDETDIVCEWRDTNKVNVDYTSRVWQCCYFSTFYHAPVEFHQLDRTKEMDISARIRSYENLTHYEQQYDPKWNFCDTHQLSTILNHKFFDNDLLESFDKTTKDSEYPRIYRCAKHCGSRARTLDKELRKINEKIENNG